MINTLILSTRRLSDDELLARVKDLACRERQVTSSLITHLAELDERRAEVIGLTWPLPQLLRSRHDRRHLCP